MLEFGLLCFVTNQFQLPPVRLCATGWDEGHDAAVELVRCISVDNMMHNVDDAI